MKSYSGGGAYQLVKFAATSGGGGSSYSLPIASVSTLGGVKVGTGLSIDSGTGILTADAGSYSLPTATASVLGGVKVGSRLSIASGVLSADIQAGTYTLPTASASVLGGIKVGTNLSIDGAGVLSASGGGSGSGELSISTYAGLKIVYDYDTNTCSITADKISVRDSGGASVTLSAVSTSVDPTVSGLGGLDTGSLGTHWYHIWLIYNSTTSTTSAICSLSVTAPTMPSGYTYKTYLGAFSADSYGLLYSQLQIDNEIFCNIGYILQTATGNISWTSLSLSSYIPPNAKIAKLSASLWSIPTAIVSLSISSGSNSKYNYMQGGWSAGVASNHYNYYVIALETAQTVYYSRSALGDTVSKNYIYVNGWKY